MMGFFQKVSAYHIEISGFFQMAYGVWQKTSDDTAEILDTLPLSIPSFVGWMEFVYEIFRLGLKVDWPTMAQDNSLFVVPMMPQETRTVLLLFVTVKLDREENYSLCVVSGVMARMISGLASDEQFFEIKDALRKLRGARGPRAQDVKWFSDGDVAAALEYIEEKKEALSSRRR